MSCRRRARVPVPRRQTPAGAEDTSSRDSLVIVIRCAQRRPERQPRRHRLLLVSGFVRVFNAQRRPERQPRLHWHGCECVGCLRRRRSTKAGASTPATPGSGSQKSRRRETLNEGRSVNPGYTRAGPPSALVRTPRSTKAGASTPATPPRLWPARCFIPVRVRVYITADGTDLDSDGGGIARR